MNFYFTLKIEGYKKLERKRLDVLQRDGKRKQLRKLIFLIIGRTDLKS